MSWKLIFVSLHKSEHNLYVFSVGERSDVVSEAPLIEMTSRDLFWIEMIGIDFVCFGEKWASNFSRWLLCKAQRSPIGVNVMRAICVSVLFGFSHPQVAAII